MLPFALATGYEWIALYEPMQPARLWRRWIDGFVVHGAALAHEGIAFAEAGNSRTGTLPMLRGLDWSGAELWTWSPPAGEAVHEVTWNRETESWAAVLRPYVERGTSVLLSVSRDGELMDAVGRPPDRRGAERRRAGGDRSCARGPERQGGLGISPREDRAARPVNAAQCPPGSNSTVGSSALRTRWRRSLIELARQPGLRTADHRLE